MPSFKLSDEQKMIQKLARDFAENEILPMAEHHDKTHEFPWEIVKKAQELGFTVMGIPEEYGGLGFSLFEQLLVVEALGWGCAGISTAIYNTTLGILPIVMKGNGQQKEKYLGKMGNGSMASYCLTEPEAGSDVTGILTTAHKEGESYILNGSKTFITGAITSDFYTVFAYTDKEKRHKGISCFIVEKEWEGVSVGKPFEKMGHNASDTAEVIFDSVRVPAENLIGREGEGFMIAMQVFDLSRPCISAAAVGVAQRACDEAVNYAAERKSMGQPIWKHQAIGHMIADMAMQVEAARLLVWKAA